MTGLEARLKSQQYKRVFLLLTMFIDTKKHSLSISKAITTIMKARSLRVNRGTGASGMWLCMLFLWMGCFPSPQQRPVLVVTAQEERLCNGLANLCSVPVNEVLFATTHNAMSTKEDGSPVFYNHDQSLEKALQAGWYGINVDLGICNGQLSLVHSFCNLFGSRDPVQVLTNIYNFLQQDTNTVVLLLIEINNNVKGGGGGTVTLQAFWDDVVLQVSGLSDLMYEYPNDGTSWPTLGELIDARTRLIVFHYNGERCNGNTACPSPKLHDWFDYGAESDFEMDTVSDVEASASCRLTRGEDGARDFLAYNHFTRIPATSTCQQINDAAFVVQKLTDCASVNNGQVPSLLLADCWDVGGILDAVRQFNGGGDIPAASPPGPTQSSPSAPTATPPSSGNTTSSSRGGSCMSGSTGIYLYQEEENNINNSTKSRVRMEEPQPHTNITSSTTTSTTVVTLVKHLQVGQSILGLDENGTQTVCTVEAIGTFGVGTLYGNYTADHFIYNATLGTVVSHGPIGPISHHETKYEVLTSCPLGLDESFVGFTPFDSDFCGMPTSTSNTMSWSEYVDLHTAVLAIVRQSGGYWFSAASYHNPQEMFTFAPEMCRTLLQCVTRVKDNTAEEDDNNNNNIHALCPELEAASVQFLKYLTDDTVQRTRQAFPQMGQVGQPGSVSHTVITTTTKRSRRAFRQTPAGKATWSGGLLALVLGLLVLAVVRTNNRRRKRQGGSRYGATPDETTTTSSVSTSIIINNNNTALPILS